MNACPILGCTEHTKYLMCSSHWAMTPQELQQAVNKTWRLFKDPLRLDRALCRRNYAAAKAAAIAHVSAACSPLQGAA